MVSDLSKRVKIASVAATWELAGFSDPKTTFDPATQAFLPSSLNNVSLGRLRVPSDYASVKDYDDATKVFNQTLFDLADSMPNVNNVFWTSGSNSRAANLETFLQWVDTGAQANQQFQQQYDIAKAKYKAALSTRTTDVTTAYTEWHTLHPSGTIADFDKWLYTEYFSSTTIKLDDKDVLLKQSAFDNAAKLLYGPLGALRSEWENKQQRGQSGLEDPGFTMEVEKTFEPSYDFNRDSYGVFYSDAQSDTVNNTPAKPNWQATKSLNLTNTDTSNFNSYGLDSTKINGDVFVADPFLFWAEGSTTSSTEKWAAYNSNNISSANVSVCAWKPPVTFDIKPGKWGNFDPKTTFTTLLPTAPSNVNDLVYPYVSQVVVTYGVGWEITLDEASYQSLYQHVYSKSETRVVGIFAWEFELNGSYDATTEIQNTTHAVHFDSEHKKIIVAPQHNTLPVVIGVVVNKTTPKGPQAPVNPLNILDIYDIKASERVAHFLGSYAKVLDKINFDAHMQLQDEVAGLLKATNISARSLIQLVARTVTALNDSTSSEKSDEDSEINIEQQVGAVKTSVRITSRANNTSDQRSENQPLVKLLQDSAIALFPSMKHQITGTPVSSLLATGLSDVLQLQPISAPLTSGSLSTDQLYLFATDRVWKSSALYKDYSHSGWWKNPNGPFKPSGGIPVGSNIRIDFNINSQEPGQILDVEVKFKLDVWEKVEFRDSNQCQWTGANHYSTGDIVVPDGYDMESHWKEISVRVLRDTSKAIPDVNLPMVIYH